MHRPYFSDSVYSLYIWIGLRSLPRKNPKSAVFLYFARRSQRQAARCLISRASRRASSLEETALPMTDPCPSRRALCPVAYFESVAARILEEHRIVTRSFVIAGPFDRASAGASGDLRQAINF